MLSKVALKNAQRIGVRSMATVCSYTEMGHNKHEFVHFVNAAVQKPNSMEAHEMYKFLMKCFVDNDTNYDGLVGFKGFDAMLHEAAIAPRRFGFAPHESEMYENEAAKTAAHKAIYDKIAGDGGVTFEAWYAWSMSHIKEKDHNLVEHHEARWERSAEDFASFFKGVSHESSTHCPRSSSSTQYKEFYILCNQNFSAADHNNDGSVCEEGFGALMSTMNEITHRFGHEWFADVKFSNLATGGRVTWKNFFDFCLKTVQKHA